MSVSESPLLQGRVAILATMHRKEQVMAPLLEQEFGVKIRVPENFNTDLFGTFTREIQRPGTQRDAARLKAEKALALTGETLAFASEGSFGPHPALPYLPANRELVLLLDTENQLELIGESLSTETNYRQQWISSVEEGLEFAEKIGFPEHGLVIKNQENDSDPSQIVKGIITEDRLITTVTKKLKNSATGKIWLETDMRAMYNATRLKNIEQATLDLIQKFNHRCPQCQWPGFEITARKPGLPCSLCEWPTSLTRSVIYQCHHCGFTQENLFPDGRETADPVGCAYCNP